MLASEAMTRSSYRLIPLLFVALVALTVCAVSLAHTEMTRGDICVGAKAGHESPGPSTGDLPAVPLGDVSLMPPDQPASITLPDSPRECARTGPSAPHTPRAPPSV